MLLMVVLRRLFKVVTFDSSALTASKLPTFPAFPYTGDIETSSTINTWDTSMIFDKDVEVNNFLKHGDYPDSSVWEDPDYIYN